MAFKEAANICSHYVPHQVSSISIKQYPIGSACGSSRCHFRSRKRKDKTLDFVFSPEMLIFSWIIFCHEQNSLKRYVFAIKQDQFLEIETPIPLRKYLLSRTTNNESNFSSTIQPFVNACRKCNIPVFFHFLSLISFLLLFNFS